MSIQDTVGVYDAAEFADNPEARCPIVLILDVSSSIYGNNIDTVNRALVKFRDIIREDPVTALRADIAVIEFDHEARAVRDFTNGTEFEAPVLPTKYGGPTGYHAKAINLALDIIEARKQSYRDGGIAYYRSLVYFLTDGRSLSTVGAPNIIASTDQSDFLVEGFDIESTDEDMKKYWGRPKFVHGELAQAAARLFEMEQNRSIAFFSFLTDSGSNGIAGLVGFAMYIERVAWLVDVSIEELRRAAGINHWEIAGFTNQMRKGGNSYPYPSGTKRGISVQNEIPQGFHILDIEKAAELAGVSEPEFIEMGVREGVIWTPLAGLSKLSPPHRPPVLLANMEQIEGSIEWLSRSVAAVSQSQPGDSIRLPAQDFLQR